LAHFGLFLLWQPLWRGERQLEPRYVLLVVCGGFALAAFANWWLIAIWVAVLFGLVGGAVPGITDRRQRFNATLAALYLLSLLLMWVVPHLFIGQRFDPVLDGVVRYGLPVLPLAIFFIRPADMKIAAPLVAIDLVYSVVLFLLVTALVLGSFVVKEVSRGEYLIALAQTLFGIAVLLLALSWLWNPRGGFAGMAQLLSRYLMSLGLPFERWVQQLAALAEQEHDPQRFLAQALADMCALQWISGIEWEAGGASGFLGSRSHHSAQYAFRDLQLTIHTSSKLSPALLLHLQLLTQMVGHFLDAKRREELQRQNAYTQAIHETGARLTHDVKNLLQSLRSLCAAAESTAPEQAPELVTLVQRQLPQITQRLNNTLDKLKAPQPGSIERLEAATWWGSLTQRHAGRKIAFSCGTIVPGSAVPGELFDRVADNLIENALGKAAGNADLQVRVAFEAQPDGASLTVSDNGAAVPEAIANRLFHSPVTSRTGLGVGLHQSAQHAEQLGYRLSLARNEEGDVHFTLARDTHRR
ncbi:MAG TPA: sensor histidine kinase, partial [Burkholderiales bacterium]|nr:sensor histidine kinase [Burkholderiales bacterium]